MQEMNNEVIKEYFEHIQKNKNVYSIMIEINRNLYLKENSNLKNENFVKTKQIITNYLNILF